MNLLRARAGFGVAVPLPCRSAALALLARPYESCESACDSPRRVSHRRRQESPAAS